MKSQNKAEQERAYVCDKCFKRYLNQTSLSTHKKKHPGPNLQMNVEKKDKKNKGQKAIYKKDVEWYEKAYQCKKLSQDTYRNIIYQLLKDIFPQKQLKYGSSDNYGQFAQTLKAIISKNQDLIDDYYLPTKQREYCYKYSYQLAQEYKLQKIQVLAKDIQICKPHIISYQQIHMIWDLIKLISLDVAKVIYLHLLCIIVQKYYSEKRSCAGQVKNNMPDYKLLKEKINNFKDNAYPNHSKQKIKDLDIKLQQYVQEWTQIFQDKSNQITQTLRKNAKKPKKQQNRSQN